MTGAVVSNKLAKWRSRERTTIVDYSWMFENKPQQEKKRLTIQLNSRYRNKRNINWETREAFSFKSTGEMHKFKKKHDKYYSKLNFRIDDDDKQQEMREKMEHLSASTISPSRKLVALKKRHGTQYQAEVLDQIQAAEHMLAALMAQTARNKTSS